MLCWFVIVVMLFVLTECFKRSISVKCQKNKVRMTNNAVWITNIRFNQHGLGNAMDQPHLTSCKLNACRSITTIPLGWEAAKLALVSQGARVTHLSQPPTKFVSRKLAQCPSLTRGFWSYMARGFLISVMKDGVDKASFRECWYFCCASSERAN